MDQIRRAAMGCVVLTICLGLAVSGVGRTNVASSLDLGMGSRPLGMGNAFVSVANDSNAVVFNPAGLVHIDGISVSSSYESRLRTFDYGHVTAAGPGFGLSVHYFDFGVLEETDREGRSVGYFTYRDVGVTAGVTLVHGEAPGFGTWSLGLGAKFVQLGEQYSRDGGRGAAADIGFLVRQDDAGMRVVSGYGFGMMVENLVTTGITWGLAGYKEEWPINLAFGASVELGEFVLIAIGSDIGRGYRLGIECTPGHQLALRAGVKYEEITIWSAGMGIRLPRLSLDYAATFHRFLAGEHRLTFTVYVR